MPQTTVESVTGKAIPVYDVNHDNAQMDQEGFLKVLLTSFRYQDPFETQDIAKFIENTVKLRELEVMKKFEDSVQSLNDNNTLFLNATNLIGKSVLYKGERTYVENGKTNVSFELEEDAPQATVYLYDEEDNVVAKKTFTDLQAKKRYSFEVDDSDIADGYYRVSVVAQKESGGIKSEIYSTAKVNGIQKEGSNIMALIDDQEIPVSDIEKIGG